MRVLDLVVKSTKRKRATEAEAGLTISAVIFPQSIFRVAKQFWQHTGDGVSSRRAEYCYGLYKEGLLVKVSPSDDTQRLCKGPRRYNREPHTVENLSRSKERQENSVTQDKSFTNYDSEGRECTLYIEERYGRNLDLSLAADAKLAIRRRIAGSLTANVDLQDAIKMPENTETTRLLNRFLERDVYLFPSGMSSIFNIHRMLLKSRGALKSICFG